MIEGEWIARTIQTLTIFEAVESVDAELARKKKEGVGERLMIVQ